MTALDFAVDSTLHQKYTILVTLYEGRYFIKQPDSKIYVQCRFNNEILTTDPVDYSADPIWDTELAWVLDGKMLRYLRTQRAMLKLQCFQLNAQNERELVGYLMLDLRQAQNLPAKERWLPLVHLKTVGFRPEIRLAFGYGPQDAAVGQLREPIMKPQLPLPIPRPKHAQKQKTEIKKAVEQYPAPLQSMPPSQVTIPVAMTAAGYYQIGDGHSFYLFTATIGFAGYLHSLLPNPLRLASLKSGFYFYYNLMGSAVVTERFFDLNKPSFTGERVMIRIRSSPAALRTFFQQLDHLTVYLCHDNEVLGQAQIPVHSCFETIGVDRLLVDAVYPMAHSEGATSPSKPSTTPPTIGVTLSLEKELSDPYARSPSPSKPIYLSQGTDVPPQAAATINRPVAGSAMTAKPEIPPNWHYFRLAVDLRSLKNLKQVYDGLYCKYAYAPLTGPDAAFTASLTPIGSAAGSHAPASLGTITTYPPTHVFPDHENLLPHSFCSFEFYMDPARLIGYLDSLPLRVEIWARRTNEQGAEDEVHVGTATCLMDQLQRATKESVPEMGLQATRQRFEQAFEAFEDKTSIKIGDLTIVFVLEDFGARGALAKTEPMESFAPSMTVEPIIDDDIHMHAALPGTAMHTEQRSRHNEARPPPSRTVLSYSKSGKPVNIRQTLEYKAVIDLETWKQTEREKFEQKLNEKESALMERMTDEWKQREAERETRIREKANELQKLEAKANSMVKQLEERERKFHEQEQEFHSKQKEMEQSLEKHMTEARDNARRLTDEFAHQIKIERLKLEDYERQKEVLLHEKKSLEAHLKKVEAEFLQYRQKSLMNARRKHGMPEDSRLRSEIDQLTTEKKRIEEEVAATEKSKRYYKQAWMKALQDLNDLKKQMEEETHQRLDREQRELDHLRMRYLAKEEQELDQLTHAAKSVVPVDMKLVQSQQFASVRPVTPADLEHVSDPNIREEASRLLKEKESLVKTGVYNEDDKIVRTLNDKIQSLVQGV